MNVSLVGNKLTSLRTCVVTDGYAVAELVREVGTLEPNTTYAYLLLCSHFGDTCVVAELQEPDGSRVLLGCLLAYRLPRDPTHLFVWQIGVAERARGRGLALAMLQHLLARPALSDVRYLEQTIAPSNLASNRLFEAFSRQQGWLLERTEGFRASDFGSSGHEEERLVRLGPRPRQ